MGEAKRRKQLGLMPKVQNFELIISDYEVKFNNSTLDSETEANIIDVIKKYVTFDGAYIKEYRAIYIISNLKNNQYNTLESVEEIVIPKYRKISGDVVLDNQPKDQDSKSVPIKNGYLRIRDKLFSYDSEQWFDLIISKNPHTVLETYSSNKIFEQKGKKIGVFSVKKSIEGRIDIDPEPDAAYLSILENASHLFFGSDQETWNSMHKSETDGDTNYPLYKRSEFELREYAPVNDIINNMIFEEGDLEVHFIDDCYFSSDGTSWTGYDRLEESEDYTDSIESMLDVEYLEFTVFSDGRIEYSKDEIPEEYAANARLRILEYTGAGDSQKWAEWSKEMLHVSYNIDIDVSVNDMPVPVGVVVEIDKESLDDLETEYFFFESSFTLDGETWHDLYDEDLPSEIAIIVAKAAKGFKKTIDAPSSDDE